MYILILYIAVMWYQLRLVLLASQSHYVNAQHYNFQEKNFSEHRMSSFPHVVLRTGPKAPISTDLLIMCTW